MSHKVEDPRVLALAEEGEIAYEGFRSDYVFMQRICPDCDHGTVRGLICEACDGDGYLTRVVGLPWIERQRSQHKRERPVSGEPYYPKPGDKVWNSSQFVPSTSLGASKEHRENVATTRGEGITAANQGLRTARAQALLEAVDEIHKETRWQAEQAGRGVVPDRSEWVDRLLMLERILIDRAKEEGQS